MLSIKPISSNYWKMTQKTDALEVWRCYVKRTINGIKVDVKAYTWQSKNSGYGENTILGTLYVSFPDKEEVVKIEDTDAEKVRDYLITDAYNNVIEKYFY